MRVVSAGSTYCFVEVGGGLAQVVRVVVEGGPPGTAAVADIAGDGLRSVDPWRGLLDPDRAGQPDGPAWSPALDPGLAGPGRYTPAPPLPEGVVIEVPVIVGDDLAPGITLAARVEVEAGAERDESDFQFVVRQPGWRMLMVPHFHYDPVWWNTQAGYTSGWDDLVWAQDKRESFQHTGLALVEAHLQRARVDPLYKFVLAEVDYLKPFWDLYPDRRAEVRGLLESGRLEIVGGTYNEPNTNLTGAETSIRAAVYGVGFQRDVMGADPQSAWQLDVFGHDPQFPGIMAECGLTSSAWARGPFHQWGPHREVGSNTWMQFPSEFEWVAPNGKGLLTSYMPNHYSSGWEIERATTAEGAMWRAYELFSDLADVSATKITLLPVGTDYTPPSRFITDVARSWGERYAWPRFEMGLPREFFAAVRAELAQRGAAASPQSRDMNPIYTGKDVSFIDTKQAQRLAEAELSDAETMAAVAAQLGSAVPHRALDKAWRQLVFGAHHDGITGSESDQVYLDLLGGWREAFELARATEERARRRLVEAVDTSGAGAGEIALVVTNTLGSDRGGLVVADLDSPEPGQAHYVLDDDGTPLPLISAPGLEPGMDRVEFLSPEIPGIGYRTFRTGHRPASSGGAADDGGWTLAEGFVIANETYEVAADPSRGGGLAHLRDRRTGFELVPDGEVANELVVYPEYPNHPRFGEGPWHLLPSGPPSRSRPGTARVHKEVSALGERLVVEGTVQLAAAPGHDDAGSFTYRQVVTLWERSGRVDLRTEMHGWAAQDRLVRLRFPTVLAGATPVSAVGDSVVARGHALIDVDSAEHPWTLDNPAAEWFGLSTTLVLEAADGQAYHRQAVGVAEVVTPVGQSGAPWARELVVALVQKGVTATCSEALANRYGALEGDSNLPDFRIAVGGPEENPFVALVLQSSAPEYRALLDAQLASSGGARVLVPAERPLRDVWQPGADLRGPRALPVVIVAGTGAQGQAEAASLLAIDISTGRVAINQPSSLVPHSTHAPDWTAALLNRGTPSFAVDSSGAMHVSVLRACTGWPSGVWIDPPRRFAPDGSAFELEHWSHVFEHALVFRPGDWRQAGIVEEALGYNRPLRATRTEAHGGALPSAARLFGLSSAGDLPDAVPGTGTGEGKGRAVLAALKPAGNPLASSDPVGPRAQDGGQAAPSAPEDQTPEDRTPGGWVAVRTYEAHGSPVTVTLQSFFALGAARNANLLEEPAAPLPLADHGDGGGRLSLDLAAGEISTTLLQWSGPGPAAGDGHDPAGSALAAEVAQPVFSRYWLHNKGAAPLGNQALAVHAHPTSLFVRAGEAAIFTAQVASGSARRSQAGRIEVVAPPGWTVQPPELIFSLSSGAYVQEDVNVGVPDGCRPGRYFVAVRVADDAGQAQEDVVTVDVLPPLVDVPPPASFAHPSAQVAAEVEGFVDKLTVDVPAGGTGEIGLRLFNRTAGEVRAEVQLLSPVETWPLIGPWVQAVTLPPGQERAVCVKARAAVGTSLSSWALFKVTYFGRLWYSPSVLLQLGDKAGPHA